MDEGERCRPDVAPFRRTPLGRGPGGCWPARSRPTAARPGTAARGAPGGGCPSRCGKRARRPRQCSHRGEGRDPAQSIPAERDARLLRLDQAGRPLRRDPTARGLPATVGHGLPGRSAARRARRCQGQDRELRGARAQAHPDRRLPRQQGTHHHHHRGRAQEEGRRGPDRHLLRPGQGAQGRGHPRGDAEGEGALLRLRQARDQERGWGRAAALVHPGRRAQDQGEGDQLRGQSGLLRRPTARQDEEDQAGGFHEPVLAQGQRQVHRREVGRGPGEPARFLPRQRLRDSDGGSAEAHLHRRQVRLHQEEASEVAARRGAGHRGRPVPRRRDEVRGPHGLQGRGAAADLQAATGRRSIATRGSRRATKRSATSTARRATSR